MAKTAAEICNLALGRLGIKVYVSDLAADQTTEAETCNVFYETMRDVCLAAFPWPFATLRAKLAQIAVTDEPTRDGWAYVFALPDDCLQERKIWPAGMDQVLADLYGAPISVAALRSPRSDQRVPFAIEKSSKNDGRVLLCDLPSPTLFYTAKVTDPAKFPALFADAFAWLLASELAMPLTIDQKKADGALKRAILKLHEAQAAALNGQQQDPEPTPETIAVRL